MAWSERLQIPTAQTLKKKREASLTEGEKEMTCLEKLKLEHPENIVHGRPVGCPSDYGYCSDPSGCTCLGWTCATCWNRIVGDGKATMFDLIKSLDLEQMAEFLLEEGSCKCCSRKNFDGCHDAGDCKTHVIEYLMSEV